GQQSGSWCRLVLKLTDHQHQRGVGYRAGPQAGFDRDSLCLPSLLFSLLKFGDRCSRSGLRHKSLTLMRHSVVTYEPVKTTLATSKGSHMVSHARSLCLALRAMLA